MKPTSIDELHAIVLAAGGSTRFGGIKQLLELDGKSMLKRAVETATSVMDERVVLVLGLRANKLQREISQYNIDIVLNENWEKGMASSLKTGIETLPKNCRGVLIIFCDQPLITEQHLKKLIDLWLQDQSKIVAGSYAGTLGVPVLFPSSYFQNILELSGDKGAKSILHENEDKVLFLALPEAEIDIDTQEDVIEILKKGV